MNHTRNVRLFLEYLPKFKEYLYICIDQFSAGYISNQISVWDSMTSDPDVFQTVKGMRLEFEDSLLHPPVGYEIPAGHKSLLEIEVKKLLKKRAAVPCEHEQGEFISPLFLRDKNYGSHRLILNLKGLSKYLEYKHFKMQTFQSVLSLIQPDCFMATIDLKDAYYSVKIDELDTKYLKFLLNSRLLKFVFLPNGLSPGPRKFTKLTKPQLALLRIQVHTVAI